MRWKDMTGQRYSKIVVIEKVGLSASGIVRWKCKCDCGKVFETDGTSIRAGRTKSCGCYSRLGGEKRMTNNEQHHPSYKTWVSIRSRCKPSNSKKSHLYYDKGIRLCKRWERFDNFIADMGEKPEGCSIDRIDGSKGYTPSNCRWATHKEQANNMATNKLLMFNGKTKTLSEWGDVVGIKPNTILYRLLRGWSVKKALKTPIDKKYNKRFSQ